VKDVGVYRGPECRTDHYTPWGLSKGFNMLILSSPSKCGFVLGFGYC